MIETIMVVVVMIKRVSGATQRERGSIRVRVSKESLEKKAGGKGI